MSFAVVCKSCQARFLLNDDLLRRRVAGRVVTVRCRQCHAAIEVDASDIDGAALDSDSDVDAGWGSVRPSKPAEPAAVPDAPTAVAEAPPAEPAEPEAAAPPAAPADALTPKPVAPTTKKAPPPRPPKSSTLMGIGAPRPPGTKELVALSPGLLGVGRVPAPPLSPFGFPEPPPPPNAVQELGSGDWQVSEPPLFGGDDVPESVDDFAEALPSSRPPSDDDMPSSTGTPSLSALTHHEAQVAPARMDDFLVNMSAAMNGGVLGQPLTSAPTIDVSALASAPAPAPELPSIDMSDFEPAPLSSKTLPLFGLNDALTAPAAETGGAFGSSEPGRASSLSPATLDGGRQGHEALEPGARERKHVVPPRSSAPPRGASQRSSLAVPVLLLLAAAAGVLIWKRSAGQPQPLARAAASASVAAPAVVAEPTLANDAPTPEPSDAANAAAEQSAPTRSAEAAPPTHSDSANSGPTPTSEHSAASGHSAASEHSLESEHPSTTLAEPVASEGKSTSGADASAKAGSATLTQEPPEPSVKEPAPAEPAGPFDRAAAAAALKAGAAAASACRKEGDPTGVASVIVTFAPSGRVTSANVSGPPFAGTATGGCIANTLRKARVPPFEGDHVTVSKTIVIE